MSKKPLEAHHEEDDDWVDDDDASNDHHKAKDRGDQESYDENYDEDKFQAEYEQYMKSLKGGNTKTKTTSSTPKASSTTTVTTTNNTTTSSPKKVEQQATTGDEKQSTTSQASTKTSVADKHHHKRPVPQWKKKSETSDSPVISSPSPSSANSSPNTTATTTATPSTQTAPTTTTTTATIPESSVKSVSSTSSTSTTSSNDGNKQRKSHKPQNQSKKHRTEDEAIDFIKVVIGKLVSSFDKLTAANAPTPQGYEDTRHKLFKNFSFFKDSPEMQTKWIDILFEQAVERGVVCTISNLLREQLEENVSQLPPLVISTLKKKIALKSQTVFKEEFKVKDPNHELEEEFQFYRRKANNILFVAKLVGFSIMEKKLAFMIIDDLLKNPTLENLKLLSIFLPEVGFKIDGSTTKKQVDNYMETIKGLVKTDIPKQLKFDLLTIIELREKNKFINIDQQLETLQTDLKVVVLEDKLADWEEWYNQLDQKEGSNNQQQQQQKNHTSSHQRKDTNRHSNERGGSTSSNNKQ